MVIPCLCSFIVLLCKRKPPINKKRTQTFTGSSTNCMVDGLQRRTNPRVEISPYSVVFIIPLPGKLVRR